MTLLTHLFKQLCVQVTELPVGGGRGLILGRGAAGGFRSTSLSAAGFRYITDGQHWRACEFRGKGQ